MTEQQQLIPLCMGERLQQERQKYGLGLAEISTALHIDEEILLALEKGDLNHLAPVYRRGYVTAYARHLKFDATEIDQMLESIGNEQPKLHTVFPEAGNPNRADRWLKATSYVLASLLIGTLAWQFTHEAVRLSQQGLKLVSGSGDNSAEHEFRPVLNATTQKIEGTTHVNASIAALDILQQQRAARNTSGDQAWAALKGQAAESEVVFPRQSGEYTLDLTASGDSWVEISDANGVQLELDLIRGGTSKQYTGVAPFDIQFGRASAISIYLNGEAVDLAPFTNGDVTQMILDGSNTGISAVGTDPGNG